MFDVLFGGLAAAGLLIVLLVIVLIFCLTRD